MNRTDSVKAEVRKLADRKPVQAAAGAGVLASAALRELPTRISRLSSEMPGYMATARTKAVREYDKLAVHGERVLHRRAALPGGNETGSPS